MGRYFLEFLQIQAEISLFHLIVVTVPADGAFALAVDGPVGEHGKAFAQPAVFQIGRQLGRAGGAEIFFIGLQE